MNDSVSALIIGLISGGITAVFTYFATRSKIRLELSVEYDKELRRKRLEVFTELWKLLKPLARYSAVSPLTYQLVKETSEKMRDWYFDVGGIYLSRNSRISYFSLKDYMQKIIENKELEKRAEALDLNWTRALLEKGTKLRDQLSDDIGTRKKSLLE